VVVELFVILLPSGAKEVEVVVFEERRMRSDPDNPDSLLGILAVRVLK